MILTLDRKRGRRKNPVRLSGPERQYSLQLRKIAEQVGVLVNGFPQGDPQWAPTIEELLRRYAEALAPWAEATAARMLADLNRRDEQAWMQQAADMSRALRDEIQNAATGETLRALMAEQVTLIKSIPLEAAERVHRLTIEGMVDSTRAAQISKAIQESGQVAKSRADLIARTEVSRAATSLTEARALHVGSPGYFWRTSGDSDVREDHRILEGQFITWDNPPIADRRTGRRAHAGCIYGCRCFPEVVFPKD
ncbi:phage head morphogenesis protein [Burkholderia ubonensis]|uniref:phage minor head protein n=1 Tax=Burkholderia ubonensis TaxID=101571 RepID=UPI00075EBE9A|nr:phage minor head protein [Burkholderia ubonensis]KVO82405.1 phage head morphogenesis protein [Burkholderia ubonensis]KVU48214.1 phage head morphogenesis protein [Burkholderia ubonensis]KVZ70648.1 phage head morphogenesis protein [Burkholderia ubonensis]KVZ70812.1 phage head morphogenesis protein [Burkholderia ubonensis]